MFVRHLFLKTGLTVIVVAGFIAPATAQHAGDIHLRVTNSAIETGQAPTWPKRVFAGTFGQSGFPEFTSNPGFDALPGTFQVGFRVGFNVRDAVTVWNGNGFTLTGSETFTISFLTATITTTSGPMPGFDLAVQPDGGWHRHLSFFINGPGQAGNPLPDPGIYLLPLELYSTDPAVESSKPFWILFNYQDSPASLQTAQAWVEENLVDPPAPCVGDLNGDSVVGAGDLGILLGAWGSCQTGLPCTADLTGDGAVGPADLGILLGAWGACP